MARSPIEVARFEAIAAAKALHLELNSRAQLNLGEGQIDVFGAIEALGITLVFKPLKSALGLCLPSPLRGIIVTTERVLSIQRFTAAHELGHAVLDHSGSIDQTLNYRSGFASGGHDLQEIAADAFAAEFLLPRWLYKYHIQKQGWTVRGHLQNPANVYQLALRMGASYEATCWGLVSHNVISREEAKALVDQKVAALKSEIGKGYRPSNSWADVWKISEKDNGTNLQGSAADIVRLDLTEASSAGFQWNADRLEEAGFEILSDRNELGEPPLNYGAASVRTIIARPPDQAVVDISMEERQPWADGAPGKGVLDIRLDLYGKERGGASRAARTSRGARIP
ncbi:MAG: ImmA/IrrE family metallo-endopeptidase [Henriciella sp.]|uniref:ImmA/IrrE family metallo-endopeptidase n=1 Tax=Henriciella sp. TaxID=1968823 RepID=UPI003C70DA27